MREHVTQDSACHFELGPLKATVHQTAVIPSNCSWDKFFVLVKLRVWFLTS